MKIKTDRERITATGLKKTFRCFKSYHEKKCEQSEQKKKEKETRKQRLEFLPGVF